ncbi:MAG TPA: M56 family metallopeptidase [Vicinamibacterales bacterium]|nr:M56 family metallopeptidase [Vicinamibacterales bacterium]
MTSDLVFVLNHLWQSTGMGLLVWLAAATWLKAYSPRLRFAAWMMASLKFLFPLSLLVTAGRAIAAPVVVRPSESQVVFDFVTTNAPVVAAPFATSPAPQAPTDWERWLIAALAVIWLSGALLVAVRWLRQWWHVRQLLRTAHPSGDYRGIPLRHSSTMMRQRIEPGAVGIWRQTILVPDGIEDTLTASQLHAVLDHEWHHARRRDNLTATLHAVVQALLWFHPLVWVIGRRLVEERELACDEAVLMSTTPDDYAEGILKICKTYWCASPGHASGITSADLKARMELIVRNERPNELRRGGRWAVGLALGAMFVSPVLVGFVTGQAVSPQNNSFVGMATSADKKFEVATIKQNVSESPQWRLGPPGRGQISILNMTLIDIITQSFRTSRPMVFGGPDWIRTTYYDIEGRGPDPTVGNPEVWEMMRSLLIERAQLKYHVEQREMPVYALTVARGGHKLTLGENGRCAPAIKEGKPCGDILIPPFGAAMFNMPIGALLNGLTRRAGRPVVDKTGLTGRYDVNVTFLPDGVKLEELDLTNIPPELRPQDMSMFEALERQAGLKLEPTREPMPVLVIDNVSRPGDN